jgi:hypothetical protein
LGRRHPWTAVISEQTRAHGIGPVITATTPG